MAQQIITQIIVALAVLYLVMPILLPRLKRARVKTKSCSGGCGHCTFSRAAGRSCDSQSG